MWNDIITITLACLSIGANFVLVRFFYSRDAHTVADKERDDQLDFLKAECSYFRGKLGLEQVTFYRR